MRNQQASTTVRAPVDVVERYLADVEEWPNFMVGVESVARQDDDTYRFGLYDGTQRRETVVAVRHQPILHRVSWESREGPAFTGKLQLTALDAEHTRVRLELVEHPSSFMAALTDMLLPRTDRAAYDLARLSEQLAARR
jgi:uncharacterized membrane protein